MLRFSVFRDGQPAAEVDLEGAHLVGQDHVPIGSEMAFEGGEVRVRKQQEGAAGLALLWPVKDFGRVLLETTRLPEREAPYNLHVELARARLMRLFQKREDWGLFGYPGTDKLVAQVDEARKLFVGSLQELDRPERAANLADRSLEKLIWVSEQLTMFHAQVFLERRRSTNSLTRHSFGCQVNLGSLDESYGKRLLDGFDLISLPLCWKQLEPKEQELNWRLMDHWVEWVFRQRRLLRCGPLASFDLQHVPDWLYIWEHDYETIRDLLYEHVQRVVKRYAHRVHFWDAISGIHANNGFHMNFEQLMELTRQAAMQTKQLAPNARVIIDLVAPWGEYYAVDQRTIPPLLYADMAVQSGIHFDAFGLQVYFGVNSEGMYVRDLMQISAMIDRFGNFGKPLHITAVQVPSQVAPGPRGGDGEKWDPTRGGMWHAPWDEVVQADWVESFYAVALSKPFVESVCWRDLSDGPNTYLPHGGLLNADLSPKAGYEKLLALREQMTGNALRKARRGADDGAGPAPGTPPHSA